MFLQHDPKPVAADALPVEMGLIVWAYAGAFVAMYLAVFAGAGY